MNTIYDEKIYVVNNFCKIYHKITWKPLICQLNQIYLQHLHVNKVLEDVLTLSSMHAIPYLYKTINTSGSIKKKIIGIYWGREALVWCIDNQTDLIIILAEVLYNNISDVKQLAFLCLIRTLRFNIYSGLQTCLLSWKHLLLVDKILISINWYWMIKTDEEL
jgi:hypothetical protein